MYRIAITLMFVLVFGSLVGCANTAPVYNVDQQAILASSGTPPTTEQVKAAIIEAAQSKGWVVEDAGDGQLIANLDNRGHQASVTITYDATSYSISYRDSKDLKYDGQNIHRNYNRWITLLRDRINQNLNKL